MGFDWTYTPEYRESLEILAEQVDGPYQALYHLWIPYIRVAPSEPETPIVIRHGNRLHLMAEPTKTLHGTGHSMDLAIHFVGSAIKLREVLYQSTALNQQVLNTVLSERLSSITAARPARIGGSQGHRHPEAHVPSAVPAYRRPKPTWYVPPAAEVPEGGLVKPQRSVPTHTRLVVGPEPDRIEMRIPAHLEAFCEREDLHPDLGDYVVIHPDLVGTFAPLPPWVAITEYVHDVQLVKPRLERRVSDA